MNIRCVETKDLLIKSKLPESDYVINPYIGCPHACKYCYARFMRRFTKHDEKWGDFLDIKICSKPINLRKIENKTVFIASTTDCYNPLEEKYKITQNVLMQLENSNANIVITTKSNLILRDINILKKITNLKVALSINTLDEAFRMDMDSACSINERLKTLKELHRHGINTVVFISPIFPYITDCKSIIQETNSYTNQYWFEELNLRGEYKKSILAYIEKKYPQYLDTYRAIYLDGDYDYWNNYISEMSSWCNNMKIDYRNYFNHAKIKKAY